MKIIPANSLVGGLQRAILFFLKTIVVPGTFNFPGALSEKKRALLFNPLGDRRFIRLFQIWNLADYFLNGQGKKRLGKVWCETYRPDLPEIRNPPIVQTTRLPGHCTSGALSAIP